MFLLALIKISLILFTDVNQYSDLFLPLFIWPKLFTIWESMVLINKEVRLLFCCGLTFISKYATIGERLGALSILTCNQ